ncbi:MAG: hypothetical protein HZA13_09120 [Nitrospirae bacterium]|nr:hypothetical protein [Nitrospirota bacterium]
MAFREDLERQGNWLFRWRSYLPLLIFPLLLIALRDSEYLERAFGDLTEDIWEGFCISLSFIGLIIRCYTVGCVPEGTSGRNTSRQKARRLNTTGMYSIVRHPLYLGNFIIFLGISLFPEVWWFPFISILAFWLYYERIIFAEEEFLRNEFGILYLEWTGKTPLFPPRLSIWQKPGFPFSFKTVLKREYSGLFAIIVSFLALDTLGDIFAEGKLELDLGWTILFFVGLIIYMTLMILKKKTNILYVEGR